MFESLRWLLVNIWNEESHVSWEEFQERVENAWDNDELSGTEYDWLMNNMG